MFDPSGAQILIAEDDPAVLELLTTRLELAGYRTIATKDGRRALDVLATSVPRAIVLDINMPNLDGFGVLESIARRPVDRRPPVLVLTARNSADDVRRCIALGAKDYLAKPFKTTDLLARVGRLVARRRSSVGHDGNDDSLFCLVDQHG